MLLHCASGKGLEEWYQESKFGSKYEDILPIIYLKRLKIWWKDTQNSIHTLLFERWTYLTLRGPILTEKILLCFVLFNDHEFLYFSISSTTVGSASTTTNSATTANTSSSSASSTAVASNNNSTTSTPRSSSMILQPGIKLFGPRRFVTSRGSSNNHSSFSPIPSPCGEL